MLKIVDDKFRLVTAMHRNGPLPQVDYGLLRTYGLWSAILREPTWCYEACLEKAAERYSEVASD